MLCGTGEVGRGVPHPADRLIHPYHADFLDMLDYFGFWESLEDWKRHLVAQVADLDPGGTDIE